MVAEARKRPCVLIMLKHFLPAYRYGGPVQSVANLCAHLGTEFDFRVLCLNHDFQHTQPYPGIDFARWNRVPGAQVMYLTPEAAKMSNLRRLLSVLSFDAMYLNSFFDPRFTIAPLALRKIGAIPKVPVLVAPRGEFSPGALGLKSFKKRPYLHVSRYLGLYRDVNWHATTAEEAALIRASTGTSPSMICTAPNLPAGMRESNTPSLVKRSGELKVIFLSRIAEKKNLTLAIKAVSLLKGTVSFDIYGPMGDGKYWERCAKLIKLVPANVRIEYKGELPHHEVAATMRRYHVFLLPTLGENFGHAIFEALAAGLPAIISDRTPWRGLGARGAGADLPLEAFQQFVDVLQTYLDMGSIEWSVASAAAMQLALERATSESGINDSRKMLTRLLSSVRVNHVG